MKSDGAEKKTDVLLVHSPTKNKDGYNVIRAHDGGVEIGQIQTVKEGEPIKGEVVKLTQRKEHSRLFDVEVLAPKEDLASSQVGHSGPAQVANRTYRENWETIFGEQCKSRYLN